MYCYRPKGVFIISDIGLLGMAHKITLKAHFGYIYYKLTTFLTYKPQLLSTSTEGHNCILTT